MPHRISKRDWRAMGGLRNSNLFRVASKWGGWRYFAGAVG